MRRPPVGRGSDRWWNRALSLARPAASCDASDGDLMGHDLGRNARHERGAVRNPLGVPAKVCVPALGSPTARPRRPNQTPEPFRSAIDQHWARCNTYVRIYPGRLTCHSPTGQLARSRTITTSISDGRRRLDRRRRACEPRISTTRGRARAAHREPQALRLSGRAARDRVRSARPHDSARAAEGRALAGARAAAGAATTGAAGAAAARRPAAGARRRRPAGWS